MQKLWIEKRLLISIWLNKYIRCKMKIEKIKQQMLIEYRTRQIFNEFVSIINKEEPNNKEIEESTIYKALGLLCRSECNQNYLSKGVILYRARILKVEKFSNIEKMIDFYGLNYRKINDYTVVVTGCNEYESKEPPLTRSPSGRNNIQGMSYLYLSENKYTACCEVKPLFEELISLAQFEVQQDLRIVNLSSRKTNKEMREFCKKHDMSPLILIESIISQYSNEVRNEKEYLATQFITDYIRKCGFDGIQYNSAVGDKKSFTIFNAHKTKIAFKDSEIISCVEKNYKFMALNNMATIMGKNIKRKDKEDVERIKDLMCFGFAIQKKKGNDIK